VKKPKKKPRKFWKTVITVTVLSETYPLNEHWELENIAREINSGDLCGEVGVRSQKRLNRKQVVKELIDMNSEPAFFDLDMKGRDTF
jgi:hypothetical protein